MHHPNSQAKRAVITLALLTLLWFTLSGGDATSWGVGLPFVLLGTAAFLSLPASHLPGFSLLGMLAFLPFFLQQSFVSGWDLAQRAFSPHMRLNPGFIRYPLRLPAGPARLLFANFLTLTPGTLSCRFEGDNLLIHALDTTQPITASLRLQEQRVGAVFGLKLPMGKDGPHGAVPR